MLRFVIPSVVSTWESCEIRFVENQDLRVLISIRGILSIDKLWIFQFINLRGFRNEDRWIIKRKKELSLEKRMSTRIDRKK